MGFGKAVWRRLMKHSFVIFVALAAVGLVILVGAVVAARKSAATA